MFTNHIKIDSIWNWFPQKVIQAIKLIISWFPTRKLFSINILLVLFCLETIAFLKYSLNKLRVISRSDYIFKRHKFVLFVSILWYFWIFILSLFSLLQKLLLLYSDLIEWIWVFFQIFCILHLTCRYLQTLAVSFLFHLRDHWNLLS